MKYILGSRRIAAAVCSCVLALLFTLSSFAETEYKAKDFFYGVALNIAPTIPVTKVTDTTQSFTVDISSLGSTGTSGIGMLALGAEYDVTDYVKNDKFTIMLTFQYTAVNVWTNSSPTELYVTTLNTNQIPWSGGEMTAGKLISDDVEYIKGSNQIVTYRVDDISWDDIHFSAFFFNIPSSNWGSTTNIYLLNCYVGLTSAYSEELYIKEINNNLETINQQLVENGEKIDAVGGKIDNLGNKVDQAADDIQSGLADVGNKVDDLNKTLETQAQAEIDLANQEGNKASSDADQVLGDSGLVPSLGAGLWNGLNLVLSAVKDETTVDYVNIPEVKLPGLKVGSMTTPSTVLIPAQQVSFKDFLENESIQTLIKFTKVLYHLFFVVFIVDYVRKLLAKISMSDTNTNDNQPDKTDGKDPHASKSDPHGLKMR